MSTRDRSGCATGDEQGIDIPLCQWERNCHGGLVASWRRGCLIRTGIPLPGEVSRDTSSGACRETVELNVADRDFGTHSLQPTMWARRAERYVTAAVITVLYVIVGIALVLGAAWTGPL